MKGDEICDDVLNLPECQFDGGDCVGVSTEPTGPTTSPSSVVIPPGCIIPPGFPIHFLGDVYCDPILNTEACEFDMGDCDNSALGSTTTPANNCFLPPGIPETWLGDGVCDHVLNNELCDWDGGDCIEAKFQNCSTPDWLIEMWYDDGVCDAILNNPECGYDGSDCYDEVPSTTVANSFPNCNPPVWVLTIWIGDGVCDTQLNNPDCGNDEGDCDDGIASTIQPITTTQPNNCNPPQPFMIQWIGRYCKSDKILKTTFSLYLSHER